MCSKMTWRSPFVWRNFDDTKKRTMDKYHVNIRTIRKRIVKNQEEMADLMGIQRSTYGRFERGETHLFTANARRFMRATGKRPEDIIDLDGDLRTGILREAGIEDRVYELSAEVKELRAIIESLSEKIDKLSKK